MLFLQPVMVPSMVNYLAMMEHYGSVELAHHYRHSEAKPKNPDFLRIVPLYLKGLDSTKSKTGDFLTIHHFHKNPPSPIKSGPPPFLKGGHHHFHFNSPPFHLHSLIFHSGSPPQTLLD